jgi:hypothetical protein
MEDIDIFDTPSVLGVCDSIRLRQSDLQAAQRQLSICPNQVLRIFVFQCNCHDVHYLWIPINSPAYSVSPGAFFGHGGSTLFAGRAIAAPWGKKDRARRKAGRSCTSKARRKKHRNLRKYQNPAEVAQAFTYFDCTDYIDEPGSKGILTEERNYKLTDPKYASCLVPDIDVHGGYFKGAFECQYRDSVNCGRERQLDHPRWPIIARQELNNNNLDFQQTTQKITFLWLFFCH